jgi:nucleotide-binding universal stress UspA family protein
MTASFSAAQPCNLLVCTDGSPASQGAMEAAFVLAQRWPCRIQWFQVLECNPVFASQAIGSIPEWEQEARAGLQAMLSRAEAQGIATEILVRQGEKVHRAILAEAEKTQPELIIMGRRGRTALAGLLMGSVTARVVSISPVNVMVVPRDSPLTFHRLLVAVDGSPCSEAAWREAFSLSRTWFSHLLAVSVAQKEAEVPKTQETLQKVQAEADREGVPLDTLVLRGTPGKAIIQAAQARGSDLLILGSHGRTGLTRLIMGSVTEQVIGQTQCPVLIVKHQPDPR